MKCRPARFSWPVKSANEQLSNFYENCQIWFWIERLLTWNWQTLFDLLLLSCVLQVSWYRRQKKLHETDRLLFQTKGSRQTLYIRKVNPTDFGNYSCRAENALGEARTFTELSGKVKRILLGWQFHHAYTAMPVRNGTLTK